MSRRTIPAEESRCAAPARGDEGAPSDQLTHARSLHRAGRTDEAEALCRRMLLLEPEQAEALHLLGLIAHESGMTEQAIALIGRAIAARPRVAAYHHDYGLACRRQGCVEEAIASFARALALDAGLGETHHALGLALLAVGRLDDAVAALEAATACLPDSAEAHTNLGNALRARGDRLDALACYAQALALMPGHVAALNNLGLTLHALGRLDDAEAAFARVLARAPDYAEAHSNLGNVRKTQGRPAEAIASYRRALGRRPDLAEAQSNLAAALLDVGRAAEAEASARVAVRLKPDLAEAHRALGAARHAQGRLDDAFASLDRAAELAPDDAGIHENLAAVLQAQGRLEEAGAEYQRAITLRPRAATVVKAATMLPVIIESAESIDAARTVLGKAFETFTRGAVRLGEPEDVGATNAVLAYHGLDDRALQAKAAAFFQAACPELTATAPHCRPGAARGHRARLRVGFVSRHLYGHAVGTLVRGFVERLSRDAFEVLVFPIGGEDGVMAGAIAGAADHAVPLGGRLADCRAALAAARLDVLVYPDAGAEPTTYFLSFARLAPVQCAMWGHPVTTGVPAMDVFLSARDLEPEGAEAHYTERLERLSHLPVFYPRPDMTGIEASRERLGLPEGRRLYVCPQSVVTFHPDFDVILGEILRGDPRGELVLVEGRSQHWDEALRARFARIFPDVCQRVRVFPVAGAADFLALLATADALLDPVHFTGGHAAYEAFALGAPVVTWPGRFMRGRITYGCYRQMGVMDCVASGPESYVELALRLARDTAWRRHVRGRIREAQRRLFEDPTPVRELEHFFVRACAEASARLA